VKVRLVQIISIFAVFLAFSMPLFSQDVHSKSMSINDAERVVSLLLKDKNYEGQIIVAYAKQLDPNFYGFQMIQGNRSAGNFEFTDFEVNRFTGAVWLVVGSDCSIYTSPILMDRQASIKILIGGDSKGYEVLNSLKPIFCENVT
jgi:hypothetical protein